MVFQRFNLFVFNTINKFAGKNIIIDNFFIILAEYIYIIFLAYLLYLFLRKDKIKTLYVGISVSLALILNFIIRILYYNPRPFALSLGTTILSHEANSSLPSNHATFMFSIALMLIYFKKTRISGIILLVLGIIGGFSRVFAGVHFPLDIVGSLIISVFVTIVIILLKKVIESNLLK